MKLIYEWKWRRGNRKFFLVLLKDGKKIGSAREIAWTPQCSCGPDFNCYGPTQAELDQWYGPRFVAYVGGKNIGRFSDMVAAKIAVEKSLGVSTKKQKVLQPEFISRKGEQHRIEKMRQFAREHGTGVLIREYGIGALRLLNLR